MAHCLWTVRQNRGEKAINKESEYLKRYYEMLFPAELKENEYVCLFIVETDEKGNTLLNEDGSEKKFHKFVKNFDQYQEYVNKYKYIAHVYNAIATVKIDKNGELKRKEANMRSRQVLFIDYDKKDYPELEDARDFTRLIKDKLPDMFLHAYYDSGHGYHYYVIVPKTCKIRELNDLNKEICSLVGADTNACKTTQVARIPCTYNRKHPDENGQFPFVKEIDHYRNHPYEVEHFHPCNISSIKKWVLNAKKVLEFQPQSQPFRKWDYAGDGLEVNYYPTLCTEKVLHEGANKGERNIWLGRIISMLRFKGYTETKVRDTCLEWNTRCRPPKNAAEMRDEISRYLDKEDIYKLNGCWDKITDERVKEIVRRQCDRMHCLDAVEKKNLVIEPYIGVRMSQKLLKDGRLRNDGKESMSGYEFLIMTILYKYLKPNSRARFTVKDLKIKMQWKHGGKWQLCMDIETFKKTLERLCEHGCIEMIVPTTVSGKKRKITYDDTIIKMKRGLKELDNRYIEFYYSAARAFISKQITQNEFKVFLCLVNRMKEGKSCTIESLDRTLDMGESHIVEAIKELQAAQCIDVIQQKGESGNWYNRYMQKHTNKYDDETYCDNPKISVDTPESVDDSTDNDVAYIKLLA